MLVENNPQQKYKNPSAWASIGGLVAGAGTYVLVSSVSLPILIKNVDKMKKLSELSADEFRQVDATVDKVLKDTTLVQKGVTIKKVPTVEPNSFLDRLGNIGNIVKATKQGDNAYYVPNRKKGFLEKNLPAEIFVDKQAKTIYAPDKKMVLVRFHEIGHAVNDQLSKIGRFRLKSGAHLMRVAPPIILLISLFKTKKAPNEKPKSTTDKINTFIKNNAGKLTFLAFVPMLLEEGIASLKGYKLAKQAGLSQELLAKVAKTNKSGYAVYFSGFTLVSLGTALAVKVKDAIAHKTPKKVKPKVEA